MSDELEHTSSQPQNKKVTVEVEEEEEDDEELRTILPPPTHNYRHRPVSTYEDPEADLISEISPRTPGLSADPNPNSLKPAHHAYCCQGHQQQSFVQPYPNLPDPRYYPVGYQSNYYPVFVPVPVPVPTHISQQHQGFPCAYQSGVEPVDFGIQRDRILVEEPFCPGCDYCELLPVPEKENLIHYCPACEYCSPDPELETVLGEEYDFFESKPQPESDRESFNPCDPPALESERESSNNYIYFPEESSVNMVDYYRVLEVSRNATNADIKKA